MSGALIVSLDFELYWGMQDVCPLSGYRENVLGGRAAIPRLLSLFRAHGIHATWAVVGLMMARDASDARRHLPVVPPTYRNPARNACRLLDGGLPDREPDCFFADGLIARVAAEPGMELASHTFSHYYCREPGQTVDQFRADMAAAAAIAREHGYALTSAVLPRNECEDAYIAALSELGFTAFRGEEDDWIHRRVKPRPLMRLLRLADVYLPLTGYRGFVPRREHGVWNLAGTRMFKPIFPPLRPLEGLKLRRIKRHMRHAAVHGGICHLWWHPHNLGVRTQAHFDQLEEIFSYYETLRDRFGMESLNMREAAEAESQKEP